MKFVEFESPSENLVLFDLDKVTKVEVIGQDDGRILVVTLGNRDSYVHVKFAAYSQLKEELKDRR